MNRRTFLTLFGSTSVLFGAGCAASPGAPTAAPANAVSTIPPAQAPTAATPAVNVAAVNSSAGKALVMTSNEPVTFDPALGNGASSLRVTLNAYEGLLGFKYGSQDLEPVLATDYSLSDDKKSWTFKLRPSVKFHDGSEFDAEAVRFSFDRLKQINQGLAFLVSEYTGTDVVDNLTVRVNLRNPVAPFAMMLPKILMVSPTAAKRNDKSGDLGRAWLAENTAGTGPYRSDSWQRGVQHTLVKFDGYWRGWAGQHVDRVVNRVVAEVPTQRQMLERGDVDISSPYNIDDFDVLKQNKDVVIDSAPSLTSLDFIMATHRPPMNDLRVRQALRAMFDYDGFLTSAMKSYGKPSRGPWSSKLPFSDSSLAAPKQDLAAAKALLAAAGFGDGGLKLTLTTTAGYVERAQACQILQATAKTLGVDISYDAMPVAPWYALLGNPDTSSDIYLIGAFPAYPDPDAVVYQQYHSTSSKGGFNWGYYNNPVADKLLSDGRTTIDPAQRAQIYSQLQRVLDDDATAIHVMEQDFIMLHRSYLQGYKFTPPFYEVYFPYNMSLEGKP